MAEFKILCNLLLILSVASSTAWKFTFVDEMSIIGSCLSDSGHACSCDGQQISNNPQIDWSPSTLSQSGQTTLTVDFTTPYDFDQGNVEIKAYLHGTVIRVAHFSQSVSCADLKRLVSTITCPLRQGDRVTGKQVITDLGPLGQHTGRFDIQATVTNSAGQVLACVKAYLYITS